MGAEVTDELREALEAWCQWELGSPSWADNIIEIIEDPSVADYAIEEIKGGDD